MFIAMAKLVFHRIVSRLFAVVGFERSLFTVGIVIQMITNTLRHAAPRFQFAHSYDGKMRLHAKWLTGNTACLPMPGAMYRTTRATSRDAASGDAGRANKASQVVVMAAIAKFYRRLTYD